MSFVKWTVFILERAKKRECHIERFLGHTAFSRFSILFPQTPRGSFPPRDAVPFKCDVIISEWMGYALLYEAMLYTVIDARDRFLHPEGLMIPSKACMQVRISLDGIQYRLVVV